MALPREPFPGCADAIALGAARAEARGLMSYQPDDGDSHDRRDEAHDPQTAVRHIEGGGHGAFGSEREGRE